MHTLSDLYYRITSGKWQGSIALSSENQIIECSQLKEKLEASLSDLNKKVAHGDVVILKVQPRIEVVATLFCLWYIGAVVVPIKSDINDDSIYAISADCKAKYLIDPVANEYIQLERVAELSSKFIIHRPQRVCGSDLALIIYTSGSTGNPKGIVITHSNVIAALRSISEYLEIEQDERILNISPLSFDYGLYQLLFSVYCNCSLVLYNENVQPVTLVKAIERHQITLIPALPVIATMLEKASAVTKKTLPSLRKLTNTGGHLSESTIDSLLLRFPSLKIYAMYGLSESKRALYLPPEDIQRKKGSVGLPMPGLEAKVFMPTTSASGEIIYREALPGQIGGLFVRGPSVMQGYTRADETSGTRIIPGNYRDDNWLDTGDLFAQDEDGYFFFKGRSKDLIKQGGYCLYAIDIENRVLENTNIQFAIVVGTYDKYGSEAACLFIKLNEVLNEDQESIISWVKAKLGSDYCPRIIKIVDDVKLSINGKLDKKGMAETYLASF